MPANIDLIVSGPRNAYRFQSAQSCEMARITQSESYLSQIKYLSVKGQAVGILVMQERNSVPFLFRERALDSVYPTSDLAISWSR